MSGFSTYLANSVINDTLVTPYASRYLALFTLDPTDANLTARELSAAWYARKTTGAWASPTDGVTENSNTIQFDYVTGAQVAVNYWGIYDALVAGNLLYSGAFEEGKTFNVDDFAVIGPGDIVVNLL